MASTQEPFSQTATNWDLDRLYTELASAKREVVPHKQLGLTAVEKTHLRGLLCGYRPAEIASRLNKQAKGVEVDLCNTLYRYVETLTGRPSNTLENWKDIVNWLEAAGYKTSEQQETVDWGEAPDISLGFYGREQELRTLGQWIASERCRLVALLGMVGIGKTALSVRLTEQIQDEFEYVIWGALRHAPPVEEVLADLIQFLSNNSETDLPEHVNGRVSCLIKYLREHRCLLVLDNLETIMRSGDIAGHYREGYKSYGEFLRRVGEERHNSCLMLTSREKPREIALLAGTTLPVRSLKLEGLSKEAAWKIFEERELSEDGKWERLINIYRGNPLFLKFVSAFIQDIFDGSVSEFLKQGMTLITGDISDFIEQQFDRLSDLEKKIMYQIARENEPVALPKLQEILSPVSPCKLSEALQSLVRRSLIEKSAAKFTLQPAVMEYVINRLGE
jgi:hypothetical protein